MPTEALPEPTFYASGLMTLGQSFLSLCLVSRRHVGAGEQWPRTAAAASLKECVTQGQGWRHGVGEGPGQSPARFFPRLRWEAGLGGRWDGVEEGLSLSES